MKTRTKPTQGEKVMEALRNAKGGWVNGQYFARVLWLTQFHTVIFNLQKAGENIEASSFRDEHGFKSYRLLPKNTLF